MRSRLRLLFMWVFRIASPSMFAIPRFTDVARGSMKWRLLEGTIFEGKPVYYRPIPHGSVLFPDWVDWQQVK